MASNNGVALKSAEVFTAIKSKNKHEAGSRIPSKVSPIIAVVPPSKELLDSRLASTADMHYYINDTLQAGETLYVGL